MIRRHVLLALALCVAASACKAEWFELAPERPEGGVSPIDPPGEGGMRDAAMPSPRDAAMPARDAGPFIPVARCGDAPCACDDGLDNDKDDLIDGFDPECTGARDQDEKTFGTGEPNRTGSCRDCFWDEDKGNGNDDCQYPSECLRGATPNGAGRCSRCEVSESCRATCQDRTPNGCDCFGCCQVFSANGESLMVELGERCSRENLDDPTACPPCVRSTQCRNTCERCELCPGRTLRDLPADCRTNDGGAYRCDPALTVCDNSADCDTDQYCQQGCCFTLLL